jgi:amino acid/amide ABC transporter ATP-binding protein 2, HAAT family (TC 3.A.1.4.-)
MSRLLCIRNLSVVYGGIHAVRDLSIEVNEGEMVCLIGANGAGKTTTLKAISGLIAPASGTVEFAGQRITQRAAHEIARAGLALVPEGRGFFRACRCSKTC